MPADQFAETVAPLRACAIPIAIRLLWRKPFGRIRHRRHFLDRTDAYAISFAQSAIDGPSFGHAHFGAVNDRRNIGRIGVAITNKAPTIARLIDSSLKRPAVCLRVAKSRNRFGVYS